MMVYSAKILADSISPAGHRLTSFEVTFPRIVLAEVNTHRMLSRNSASSRAIPVEKRIAAVEADPFVPEQFGKNKKGMQHDEVLDDDRMARMTWREACQEALSGARNLEQMGVHKQLANRLLEPFSWHTAVITATDWNNFFHLRVNPAAQGEFRRAAQMMLELYEESRPVHIAPDNWHLPYITSEDVDAFRGAEFTTWENLMRRCAQVSAARCARVSYLTQDGKRDPGEDLALFGRLVGPGHLSPLEHPARPMYPSELELFRSHRHEWDGERSEWFQVGTATYYLGNYNGWVQLRKLVPGEHDILGRKTVKCDVCGEPTHPGLGCGELERMARYFPAARAFLEKS